MDDQTQPKTEAGRAEDGSATIRFFQSSAVQYDFYIPVAIWDAAPTNDFRGRLLAIQGGATVFDRVTGVWEGDVELTRIYRLILRRDQYDRTIIRDAFQREISRLLVELDLDRLHQQAFLFTETEMEMILSASD